MTKEGPARQGAALAVERPIVAFVAVDWADRQHVWAARAADSEVVERGTVDNTPEAIQAWARELTRFGGLLAVALEQSRGALLFTLSQYEHLVLYPVHPGTLANFRQALCPSGAKDDPRDTDLLLTLLVQHRDRLRVWQPDTVETRTLYLLVEKRRRLVDDKTRESNRLTAVLKEYFPQAVSWLEDVDSEMAGAFLQRWPTLEQVQQATPESVREFFYQHNCRSAQLIRERLEQIRTAQPATRDQAVICSGVIDVGVLVQLLATLRQGIDELNGQIARLFNHHPDAALFRSLPGAGPVLAPRLLVALGTRRQRFAKASELQSYSGIAPVTKRSGRTELVLARHACPKFLRQTFHEWAGHSIRFCNWAAQYYQHQRQNKNQSHQAAVRALAFKWQRILFRCWQDGVPYDNARYEHTLATRKAPKPPKPDYRKPRWKDLGGFFQFVGFAMPS